jgi:hypothetical protein
MGAGLVVLVAMTGCLSAGPSFAEDDLSFGDLERVDSKRAAVVSPGRAYSSRYRVA